VSPVMGTWSSGGRGETLATRAGSMRPGMSAAYSNWHLGPTLLDLAELAR
jgi:hypothetical protein